ncbi:hypothetical protein L1987_31226 [Smallanthus sonchifolius]|uniref:Uncharacterized protein n=1 Tax=Smallanthus sonchifolius TaxID=185202 RepID=A0ACB9I4B4_9ASTR|nr:hypothetical protein L1987_31226 [Smallanthus sonchifolius]
MQVILVFCQSSLTRVQKPPLDPHPLDPTDDSVLHLYENRLYKGTPTIVSKRIQATELSINYVLCFPIQTPKFHKIIEI